jgi:hypothetical protein
LKQAYRKAQLKKFKRSIGMKIKPKAEIRFAFSMN